MNSQNEFPLEQLPEYHVIAAAARKEQSKAIRDGVLALSRWVSRSIRRGVSHLEVSTSGSATARLT